MKIEINITNVENVPDLEKDIKRYEEIVSALIVSGGLSGVKGGQTIIHFDSNAEFMGVQLNYWPWKRRKVDKV